MMNNVPGMSHEDLNNPMILYYAEQSYAHAQRQPMDSNAQMQAQYWANLLMRQRALQAQATQAQAAPALPTQAPPSWTQAPQPQPPAPGLFGAPQAPVTSDVQDATRLASGQQLHVV